MVNCVRGNHCTYTLALMGILPQISLEEGSSEGVQRSSCNHFSERVHLHLLRKSSVTGLFMRMCCT